MYCLLIYHIASGLLECLDFGKMIWIKALAKIVQLTNGDLHYI